MNDNYAARVIEEALTRASLESSTEPIDELVSMAGDDDWEKQSLLTSFFWGSLGKGMFWLAEHCICIGVEFDSRDSWIPGAISIAIYRFHDSPEIIQWLLMRGADIEHRNEHGWTPLQEAVHFNCPRVTELLLKNNANPNAKPFSDDDVTALESAKLHGYNEIYTLLKNFGAK